MPALLLAMVAPIVGKILLYLGVGWITFSAYSVLMDQAETYVVTKIGGIGAETLAYITMAGFIDGIGYVLAAIGIRAALNAIPKFGRLTSV